MTWDFDKRSSKKTYFESLTRDLHRTKAHLEFAFAHNCHSKKIPKSRISVSQKNVFFFAKLLSPPFIGIFSRRKLMSSTQNVFTFLLCTMTKKYSHKKKQAWDVFGKNSTPTLKEWCNEEDAAKGWWKANLLNNCAGVLFQVI